MSQKISSPRIDYKTLLIYSLSVTLLSGILFSIAFFYSKTEFVGLINFDLNKPYHYSDRHYCENSTYKDMCLVYSPFSRTYSFDLEPGLYINPDSSVSFFLKFLTRGYRLFLTITKPVLLSPLKLLKISKYTSIENMAIYQTLTGFFLLLQIYLFGRLRKWPLAFSLFGIGLAGFWVLLGTSLTGLVLAGVAVALWRSHLKQRHDLVNVYGVLGTMISFQFLPVALVTITANYKQAKKVALFIIATALSLLLLFYTNSFVLPTFASLTSAFSSLLPSSFLSTVFSEGLLFNFMWGKINLLDIFIWVGFATTLYLIKFKVEKKDLAQYSAILIFVAIFGFFQNWPNFWAIYHVLFYIWLADQVLSRIKFNLKTWPTRTFVSTTIIMVLLQLLSLAHELKSGYDLKHNEHIAAAFVKKRLNSPIAINVQEGVLEYVSNDFIYPIYVLDLFRKGEFQNMKSFFAYYSHGCLFRDLKSPISGDYPYWVDYLEGGFADIGQSQIGLTLKERALGRDKNIYFVCFE